MSVVINSNSGLEFPINEITVDLESVGLAKTDLTMPSKTNIGLGVGRKKSGLLGLNILF